MATITKLQELEIWQLARSFARDFGVMLKQECFDSDPGLRRQMLNASGSIMDNIAEGFGRGSKNEFVNHLTIAKGSLEETRSQLYRCFDRELVDVMLFDDLLLKSETLIKKLTALMNYLNKTPVKGTKFKNRQ